MSKVANGNLVFLVHISEEGPFVVDAEGEYAVLIGEGKGGAINGTVRGSSGGFKRETVERREHCDF
jgi:hypothetical protein